MQNLRDAVWELSGQDLNYTRTTGRAEKQAVINTCAHKMNVAVLKKHTTSVGGINCV